MNATLTVPSGRFYYVRHGETEANATRTIAGRRDVPLTPRGRAQAEEAARRLAGLRFDALCASPLKRAWDTALPIARATGHGIVPIPDLMERSWGVHEGHPVDSVSADMTPEGGESRADFFARVVRGLNVAFARGEVAIVAHSGVFRELCTALGFDYGRERLPNGVPLRFARDPGGWRMSPLA